MSWETREEFEVEYKNVLDHYADSIRVWRMMAECLGVSFELMTMIECCNALGRCFRAHDPELLAMQREILERHIKELREDDDSWKSDSP